MDDNLLNGNDTTLSTDQAFLEALEGQNEEAVEAPEVESEETEVEAPEMAEETEDEKGEEDKVADEPKKVSSSEKDNSAFAKMRIENKALTRQMSKIMTTLGFESIDEMEKALDEVAKQKEIEAGGSEETFEKKKTLSQREEMLRAKEEELAQYEMERQLDNLARQVSVFADENGLDTNLITKTLDEEGISVQELLESKNPTRVLKGIMADAIVEAKLNRRKEEAPRPTVASTKLPSAKRDAKVEDGLADLLKLSLEGIRD